MTSSRWPDETDTLPCDGAPVRVAPIALPRITTGAVGPAGGADAVLWVEGAEVGVVAFVPPPQALAAIAATVALAPRRIRRALELPVAGLCRFNRTKETILAVIAAPGLAGCGC
jgi:hypothetical protein